MVSRLAGWPVAAALILILYLCAPAAAEKVKWAAKNSDHFIICYRNAPEKYIDEVIRQAEGYYGEITREFGFTRFENYWTWDDRARVYLYDSRLEYTLLAGKSYWDAASVDIVRRKIYSYIDMEDFLDIVLPHELGHIIFREFVGAQRRLPLWLDEGAVSYLEKDRSVTRWVLAREIVSSGDFIPLGGLARPDMDTALKAAIFYAEAASVILFLIKTYGRDKFAEFCQRLRDLRLDQSWFAAARDTYGFKDVGEMNEKWVRWLRD